MKRNLGRIYLDNKVLLTKTAGYYALPVGILIIGLVFLTTFRFSALTLPLHQALKGQVSDFSSIPRKERNIHFIFGLWDDDVGKGLPVEFRRNLKAFERSNPNWRIFKWFRKPMIERYAKAWTVGNSSKDDEGSFPSTWKAWKVARPVQRADLFRYIMLWQMGGFYFDLDVEISGDNSVAALMKAVDLNPSIHTAALFYEKGRLTEEEAVWSAHDIGRDGLPEYRTRLSNYALWSRPRSKLMECAVQLATYRILKVSKEDLDLDSRLLATLYSSGPDVVTECAFGVREKGFQGSAGRPLQDEEEVVQSNITKDKVLVKDPGPNIVNGNTFSWKNEKAA
eukprot:CAMPEP_0198155282 /NCGR_PEP_ID=MMETSP1443-20131203/69053_1 /TAXON_ID=186043 /ORGANISM="Entomoneis sp., Strain CCMP2396" /LENGTH=337 /DNA_ID=CAMNT_0043822027 /DNA_START=35 /DNA_END=1048 /DNA_ORIENTATION=+